MSQVGQFDITTILQDIEQLTPDAGIVVVPDGTGNVDILGGNNITTTGTLNTLTIDLTDTTDHALQVGNATGSLTSLTVATDGQIPIGSTGLDPVISAPTNGANVSWTLGAGSLQADVTGTTDHALQLGNAGGSLTSLGVATDGQIPIGSTGLDPVLAAPTNGANISWTGGAGSLQADVTGTTQYAVQTGNAGGSLTSLAVGTDGQIIIGATAAASAFGDLTSTSETIQISVGANALDINASAANQITTGFATWDGGAPFFDDTTLGQFTLSQSGTGYIDSAPVSWTAPQTATSLVAGITYYIYVDSSGTIGKSDTWSESLFQDNIVLFEVLRDATVPTNNQITVKENHPFGFPVAVSIYNHEIIGTVIENNEQGANITLNGTDKIEIVGADELADHGLCTDIPDSGGVAETFEQMFTDGSGKWATDTSSDTFTAVYNNAGTVTALGANKYGIFTLYVSKDNLNTATPVYFAVIDTAQYNNLNTARAAIAAGDAVGSTGELQELELAQLGYIIIEESTGDIVDVIIEKATLKGTISISGTNIAALVLTNTTDFDHLLSAADTTVQAALDTIDDGVFVWFDSFGATQNMDANSGYIANRIAGALAFTLPITAAVGEAFAVAGAQNGWTIAQNAGQTIHFLGSDTTTGVGGSLASTTRYDCVELVCIGTNTDFVVRSVVGNLTVV